MPFCIGNSSYIIAVLKKTLAFSLNRSFNKSLELLSSILQLCGPTENLSTRVKTTAVSRLETEVEPV